MAQLTDQLTTINSGPSPIATPARAGGASFFKGLTDIASGFLGAQDSIRQSDAQYKRTQDEAIANDVVRQATSALIGPSVIPAVSDPSIPPGISAELEGANTEARQRTVGQMASLDRTRAAEEQGRLPPGSVGLRMDAVIQQLLRDHPGSELTVMQTLKEFGYDSYLARDVRLQDTIGVARQQSEAGQQLAAEDLAIRRFAASGGDTTSTPRSEQLSLGRAALKSDADVDRAIKAGQVAKAAADAGDENAKTALIKAGRDFYSANVAQTQGEIGNLMITLRTLSQNGSLADQSAVQAALPQVKTVFTTKMLALKATALRRAGEANLGQEDIDRIGKYYDGLIADSDKYIFAAPDARSTTALASLQTKFKLDAATSMPAYFALSSAFGQTQVNNWLENMQPGANMDAVIKEFAAYDPSRPQETGPIVSNVGRILRGELSIPAMDPVEAAKVIPSLEATVAGTRKSVWANGKVDPNEVTPYTHVVGELLNAASALPRDAKASSYWRASDSLLSPEALKTLHLVVKEDNQRGREVAFGSRQFAFQTISTMLARPNQGAWDFVYKDGKYVPVLNEERWGAAILRLQTAQNSRLGPLAPKPSLEGVPRPTWSSETNPESRAQLDILNRSINFLVETDQYDEAVPTDLTPRARRDAYARGLPVTALAAQSTAPTKAIDAVNAITDNLSSDIVTIQNTPEIAWPENDPRWLTSTVLGENFKGTDAEMQGIAATIINRARLSGQSLRDVVTAGGGSQYNVWKKDYAGRNHMLNPSPEEQARLEKLLGPLLSGDLPTDLQDLTHFYHPGGMVGGRTPEFAQGQTPEKRGAGMFYRRPGDFQRGK